MRNRDRASRRASGVGAGVGGISWARYAQDEQIVAALGPRVRTMKLDVRNIYDVIA